MLCFPKSCRAPIASPLELSDEVQLYVNRAPTARSLHELLAGVQRFGGWEGRLMSLSGLQLLFEHVDNPKLLHHVLVFDSRIIEGERLGLLWSIALAKKALPANAVENLFRNYERPAKLGGANFEWFVANHGDWAPELLARCGVDPASKAPPPPRFLEKLLAYEIPESFFDLFASERGASSSDWNLRVVGVGLIGELPPKRLFALIAQEVMSARFDLERAGAFKLQRPQPKKSSWAARDYLRVGIIIELIVALWAETFQSDVIPANRAAELAKIKLMLEFEKCIMEWIPEIRKDERFPWALDRHFEHHNDAYLARLGEPLRSFERLRDASIQEKPIVTRAYVTGAPLWPGGNAAACFASILRRG